MSALRDIDGSISSFLYYILCLISSKNNLPNEEGKKNRPGTSAGRACLVCGDKGTHFQENTKTYRQLFSKKTQKISIYLINYIHVCKKDMFNYKKKREA